MMGPIQADQDTSFQAMDGILRQMINIVDADPAVDTVNGFTGGGGPGGGAINTARMFISLKPPGERKITRRSGDRALAAQAGRVPGATLYLQAAQDIRVGGRFGAAQYQFTMRGDNLQICRTLARACCEELRTIPHDRRREQRPAKPAGCKPMVQYDRATASRFGISPQLIDNTLYDAFGQRQVSTMYTPLNQYHVVMEVAPEFWQNPAVPAPNLCAVAQRAGGSPECLLPVTLRLPHRSSVNHQGLSPSVTISFNLQPGIALGDAADAITPRPPRLVCRPPFVPDFAGTAQAYQDSLGSEPLLIAAALISVYLVLGILYESYVHPVTILSTLPSAGVGALLALMLTDTELTVIAIIGIILLIGIVKKNAILMIDFALAAERNEGKIRAIPSTRPACCASAPS